MGYTFTLCVGCVTSPDIDTTACAPLINYNNGLHATQETIAHLVYAVVLCASFCINISMQHLLYQDAYFPLLWRLCSRPYDAFLDEYAKTHSDEHHGLSSSITKMSLVEDNATESGVECSNSGGWRRIGGCLTTNAHTY